jgi:very-short-patch-repair endonuclease
VARLAGEEWGVLSLDELRACGLTIHGVGRRVRRGHLHVIHHSVYAVGHPNIPLEGRFLAAVKACGPGALLSHYAVAAHWEMVEWDGRYPEVTVLGPGTHLHPGIRVHRTQLLHPRDRRHHRSVPITSPARTIVDLASLLGYRRLRRAVRQAQALRLVQLPQLAETMNRLGPRRGVRNLRRILATGPAPTRSDLEDIVLDLILSGGLEHPDVNVPMKIDERRVVPDFRWPKQRLVVEADSAKWHEGELAKEDDAERQALLEAYGERVLRVTWEQAVAQPGQTLARLKAAGAPLANRPSN